MAIQSGGIDHHEEVAGEGGWVTNIQDFAVHDGPGLRVTVFLKGCPLRCGWCQNPESLRKNPEIEYHAALCLKCFRCLEACPVPGAIIEDDERRVDRKKCTKCMACIDKCRGKALRNVGEWMTAEKLLEKIISYKAFFKHSDRGGVTLSGGEPSFQPEFVLRFLKLCRESEIHTVIQTCGYADYETLRTLVQNVELVIYDIKHMDEDSHIRGTGKSNRLILENLERLCKEVDKEIAVHIPLICGFNDDEGNIRRTAEFVSSLKKIEHIDLLPFNELASAKYTALDVEWEYSKVKQQSPEQLAELKRIVQSYGLEVTVGGLW